MTHRRPEPDGSVSVLDDDGQIIDVHVDDATFQQWEGERGAQPARERREIRERSPGGNDLSSHPSLSSRSRSWPGGLGRAAFHGLPGTTVEWMEPHTEADPAAVLVQLLTAFGNSAGRGAHFQVEGDQHMSNLFALIVGDTAKGRKGTSWGRVRQVMEHADPAWVSGSIVDGLSSAEGLIHVVRDPVLAPGDEGDDEVIEEGADDKRLLVQEGEFAAVLQRMRRQGNALSPVIRTLWDRGEARTLTRNSPVKVTGGHVSIVGHITADELRREMSATDAANGFANRFLFVCSRRSKVIPRPKSVNEAELRDLAGEVREALRFAGTIRRAELDDRAARLWDEVYEVLSEGRRGLLGAVTSRAEAITLRVALIYALMDQAPVIGEAHLRAALELWRYCEQSARYIFGDAMGDPLADELLAALRLAGNVGLTRTEIRSRVGGSTPAARIDTALTVLLDHGRARSEREPTGGRAAERWFAADPAPLVGPEREQREIRERSHDNGDLSSVPYLPSQLLAAIPGGEA